MNKKNLAALLIVAIALAGCGGGGSTASSVPAPTVSLTMSQSKVSLGSSVNLTWSSTNTTGCIASGAWSGNQAVSGTAAQTPTTSGATAYTITCTGAGGTASQTATLTVPIPVQKSSYLNAKNLNISSQKIPAYPGVIGPTGYSEIATGGVGFADFIQTGELSLVTFTNRLSNDTTKPNPIGAVYFYKYVNGQPVDITSSILQDTTGCISPRRLLIADFNGDGKPDVLATCHGSEFGDPSTWTGEHPRLLLSQPDGTYKNVEVPITCYCHGATAADINGDGKIDILTSDALAPNQSKSSYIALLGDGAGNFTVVQNTGFINPEADYVQFDKRYYNIALTLELLDFDGDGIPDLFIGSGEKNQSTYILKGDGNGNFNTIIKTFPKTAEDFHVTDIVYINGILYQYIDLNGGVGIYLENYIRKYDSTMSNYSVIYQGPVQNWTAPNNDFIFIMPYNNTLVPYDAKFGKSIPM